MATMLAANPNFKIRLRLPSFGNREFHQPSHPCFVKRFEWIVFQQPLFNVLGQEFVFRVFPRETERSLSEVVGAKGEEVSFLRKLVCRKAGPHNFNHTAKPEGKANLASAFDLRP